MGRIHGRAIIRKLVSSTESRMAKHQTGFILIRGALIADPGRRRAAQADVLIENGIVRDVRPGIEPPGGASIVDAAGMLIHPGLVNSHTHGHGSLARGQGDRWSLELLLAAAPWIGGNRSLADKKIAASINAAELVLKGCTAAYDLYYEFPAPTTEGMDAVAEAYDEVGMRAVIAPMVADKTFYDAIPGLRDALPPALAEEVGRFRLAGGDRTLDAIASILRNWRWTARDISVAVAPTIPTHCSHEFLCGCAKVARSHGVPLHSHVGESKVQAISGLQRYGKSLTAYLDDSGLLGPDFTAAHGIWLDDDDLRRLADRGASIAHNPGSNMKLGNGHFRFRKALNMGVNVGIGTDGSSASDNQNMYEAMRYASMMSKVQSPDPQAWVSVDEIYGAATRGAAKALGIQGIGAISPGFKADIVFIDLERVNWIPHNWTVGQLVQVEDATSVRHVMIGGSFVVKNSRLLTIDMSRLAREAEAARERLEAMNAESKALFGLLEPVVGSFCPTIAHRPYEINRYACNES